MKQMIPTEDVMKISKTYISNGSIMYEEPDLFFDFYIPVKDYESLGKNGLIVLMFNTTSVTIPFYKTNDNSGRYRFVCNAVYDEDGNSMVTRGVGAEPYLAVDSEKYILTIVFDEDFTEALVDSGIEPYGVVRFITFN